MTRETEGHVLDAAKRLRECRVIRFSFSVSVRIEEDDLKGVSRVRRLIATSLVRFANRARTGEGIMEVPLSRYAIDYGAYAVLVSEGREWRGPSGLPVEGLGEPARSTAWTPLTIVNALSGAVEVHLGDDAGATVDEPFVRAEVRVERAALPPGIPFPGSLRTHDSTTMRVELKDGLIARIRVSDGRSEFVLGVHPRVDPADSYDWSYLPSFFGE